MALIRLIALFLIIVTFVLVIVYGISLSRKAKAATNKVLFSRYFIILIVTFLVGGITRTLQQNTGIEWLNGLVPIFGGLYLSLLGIPFVWWNSQTKYKGLMRFLFFLLGLYIMSLSLGLIYLGITQVWEALL